MTCDDLVCGSLVMEKDTDGDMKLYPSKISVSNGARTNLYWEEVELKDGRTAYALCGWKEA